MAVRKKVKINVHDAVMMVMSAEKGARTSLDRTTLRKVMEALRAGNWEITPAAD